MGGTLLIIYETLCINFPLPCRVNCLVLWEKSVININIISWLDSRVYQHTVISKINLILVISGWRIIFWSRIHFYFFNLMHPCLAISKRSQGSKEADLNHSTNRRRLLTNQKQLFSHMDLLCPTGAEQSCDWIAGLLLVNET